MSWVSSDHHYIKTQNSHRKSKRCCFKYTTTVYQNSNYFCNKHIQIVKVYIVNRLRNDKARRQVLDDKKGNIKLMDENSPLLNIIPVNWNSSPVSTIMNSDNSFKTFNGVLRYTSNTIVNAISSGSHRSKISRPVISVHNPRRHGTSVRKRKLVVLKH